MEQIKLIFCVLIIVFFTGCVTNTPIVLEPVPKIHLKEDISLDDYLSETLTYTINLKSYLESLINQIKNKVPYLELKDNTGDLK